MGYSPLVLSWTSLVVYAFLGTIVKPLLLMKIVDYKWLEIWSVYRVCIIVTLISLPIPVITNKVLDTTELINFILVGIICVSSVGFSVFFFGIDKIMRKKVIEKVCNYSAPLFRHVK